QKAWDWNVDADIFRKSGYNHLSDLMTKCHRMLALINRFDLYPAPKRLFDQNVVVFAQGNMLHDEVRRRFANNVPQQFYGFWRCQCKQTCVEGTRSLTMDTQCESCGTNLDEYVELRIIIDDVRVGHSIDSLFLLNSGQLVVGEIKSCTKEKFLNIKDTGRAESDHIAQGSAYWRAMRSAGYDVAPYIEVIYACKEWVTPSQMHTVRVPMNDTQSESFVRPYYANIDLINETNFNAPLPPRQGNCTKCGMGGAKYCPAAALCFLLPDDGVWNGSVRII
ncbi:MAG: hypothetical protein LPH21_15905, partial [Shewanella sp.]|nr:hypothetical protein [Shewanella sp.]